MYACMSVCMYVYTQREKEKERERETCVCVCVTCTHTHTHTHTRTRVHVCIYRRAEAGEHGRAGWPNTCYGVSKAAINALTRIQARDLAGRQILVNSCCPGWCATDMSSHSGD